MKGGKGLKLPVVKGDMPPAKYLSMDDYLKFVTINLEFVASRGKHAKGREKMPAVNASFSI